MSFRIGARGTFTVTVGGSGTPAITRTGDLPSGVTFTEVPSVDDVAGKWGEITDLSAAERATFSLG